MPALRAPLWPKRIGNLPTRYLQDKRKGLHVGEATIGLEDMFIRRARVPSILCLAAAACLSCRSENPGPLPKRSSRESTSSVPAAVAMTSARALEQLIDSDQPGITVVRSWVAGAKNPVEALQVERGAGERALLALQVTSRSPMGAIALETGGILIDHGWVRVLGGGDARLARTIQGWNGLAAARPAERLPGAVLVADDAVGGLLRAQRRRDFRCSRACLLLLANDPAMGRHCTVLL
jgi:hypothetical protein